MVRGASTTGITEPFVENIKLHHTRDISSVTCLHHISPAAATCTVTVAMLFHRILALASATVGALARPPQDVLSFSKPRPLVIWHGLGESLLLSNGKGQASDQVGLKATRTPPLAWCNFSLSSPKCTPEYSYIRYISMKMRRKTNGLPLCVPCTRTTAGLTPPAPRSLNSH